MQRRRLTPAHREHATSTWHAQAFGAEQTDAGSRPLTCETSARNELCSTPPIAPSRRDSTRLPPSHGPTLLSFASALGLVRLGISAQDGTLLHDHPPGLRPSPVRQNP